MAERRMFAKTIIDSDAFLDMPLSTQLLYFHLSMRADDEGFINNPKKIQRMVGCSDDDAKLLIAKRFIIPFDSGIVVVKHWRIHNYIQKDRFNPTKYQYEKSFLELDENKAYRLTDTPCIQDVSTVDTQVRLGKVRLGKDRVEETITVSNETVCQTQNVRRVIEAWNELGSFGIMGVSKISSTSKRYQHTVARIKEYGVEAVLSAIERIKKSSHLRGKSKSGWIITFDWFVLPNNFPKVLDGNYDDRGNGYSQPAQNQRGGGGSSNIFRDMWEEEVNGHEQN